MNEFLYLKVLIPVFMFNVLIKFIRQTTSQLTNNFLNILHLLYIAKCWRMQCALIRGQSTQDSGIAVMAVGPNKV